MKQELIKPVVRVGNSAGVLLPREWLKGKARVELVEKPLDMKKDILDILEPYLEDIIGIYLVGSYARGEQTKESDVDVLVITEKTKKRIEKGRYEIILLDKKSIEKSIEKIVLPLVPMIKEAKTLLNESLIAEYKRKVKLTRKNAKPIIGIAKSALGVNKASIDLDREWPSDSGDSTAYSLILHIRSLYLIDCLRKNKKGSSRELISLVKKITGSLKAYDGYMRVKNDEKIEEKLPLEEAEKLYEHLKKEVEEAERWLREKKD